MGESALTTTAAVIYDTLNRHYTFRIVQSDKEVFVSRHSYDGYTTSSHDVGYRHARYMHTDDFLRALRSHFVPASTMKSRRDEDALARAQFEKNAKHYEEIEKSRRGLTFAENMEWMKLVKAENERLKSVKESMG